MTIWTIEFKLNTASHLEAHREEGAIRASVQKGSDVLRVENVPADSGGSAREAAERFANEFLDTVAYRHDEPLQIVPFTCRSEHIGESGRKVVGQDVGGGTLRPRGSLLAKKMDAQGNVVEVYDSERPGRIGAKTSQAAAWYRRGSLSADPFDQFRNFYLAADNVADQIRVAERWGELYEQDKLSKALAECFAGDAAPLLGKARAVPGFAQSDDPFDAVARLLYKAYRCQLSHAKAQESKKVPFNPHDEETVKKALPLMRFVAESLLHHEASRLQHRE